ncbi:AAA family ATPase [Psychrobacillus sp. MER TA 171]|uniref:AAA family ATPase n=1 Tax=Psychrobacillus sp. MER TA 171 TaxID=2939577 RepID=UPI00204094AE|nr:AAA family ATPase [Psychrobacillus sp. MER TA 171]MCM3358656.1 AAA family ATPase [Psychrobacillus sp. MER TA 171]
MIIKQINLKNFRGYEEFFLTFSPTAFTLLVGENGSGKTAALEGISIGLSAYFQGFHLIPSRNISHDDIHLKKYLKGSSANAEPQFPVEISCIGNTREKTDDINWHRKLNSLKGKTTRKEASSLINFAKKLQSKVMNGEDINLPIICYYGTQRLWNNDTRIKRTDVAKLTSRTHAYLDSLNPDFNVKLLTQWFIDKKWVLIEDGIESGEMKAVQKAIQTCLVDLEISGQPNENWQLDYSMKNKELQFTFSNGEVLPFRLLSDGYRNTIGMVADIAFRMASLNPHLEENAVLETPGIIIIDELDLHLHPKWQRRIVDDLKRTFPKIQFIASTHSPFIIQSIEEGELRILKNNGQVLNGGFVSTEQEYIQLEYADESIEDVIENIMGIEMPQRSRRKTAMYNAAKEYFETLKIMKDTNATSSQIKILKEKLDVLSLPYIDNVAYYAFLQQKRVTAELEKEREDSDNASRE